uniref:uncharacterized protein LOC122583392 n=1 Tax=Erigeron canadensis TaxID=72917 RepID=UPI001CB902A8|nr:uncharacterized protein LOC122583392 [Erigeron canadensis]
MASLTPGTLSKLLQNINNPSSKITGDHRSPLLQVIGIVPQDDVFDFDNKGFYLRVSDSLHSAYVSVQKQDVELILNDKIQLGQFVYVTRLVSGSPVPVLFGLKPVSAKRVSSSSICIGNPKDLISSDVLVVKKKNVKESISISSSNNLRSNGKVFCGGQVESRRLSLDYSSRKGWDQSPVLTASKHRRSGSEINGGFGAKFVEPFSPVCRTPVRSVRKASSVKDMVLKSPNVNVAPLKNKNVIVSEKLMSKPIKKDLKTSFDNVPVPSHLTKVPITSRTLSEAKISWDCVSPTVLELGKEAICHRNQGFSSAVHALEETSAMDNILQCMSVFAEICKLAETSRNPLVEQFLNFYQKLHKSTCIVNTLIDSKLTMEKSKGRRSNSSMWVQAALETNLAKFTLFTMEENRKNIHGDGNYHLVLENASEKIQVENRVLENKKSPRTNESVTSRVRCTSLITKQGCSEKVEWSKGSGIKETANLGEKLISVSQKWFLDYLEDSLNKGFGLKKGEDSGVAIGLLGQLKRVNQWLDDSVCGDDKVENLKKILYRFLLDHVHVQKAAK